MAEDNLLVQVDALLQKSESLPDPAARELLSSTVRAIMDLHGEGLSRIMEKLAAFGERGAEITDSFAADEMISGLLLLYGLHPQDLAARVRAALEQVRPYLASHGGNVELLNLSETGELYLQMQGSCHGCPSSALTLKNSIEQAIYDKAPDITAIHVAGVEEPAHHAPDGFVPVEQVFNHSLEGTNYVST